MRAFTEEEVEEMMYKSTEHDGCKGCKYEKCNMESKECQGCKHNAVDKYTRMTQADRIRSMSDEELADYIFGVSVHEKPCVLCSDDCDFCELTDEECKNRTLKWLQSEVEE